MKLASFHAAGRDRLGVVSDSGELLDLFEAAREAGLTDRELRPFSSLQVLIEAGEEGWTLLQDVAAYLDAKHGAGLQTFTPDAVTWLAPVTRPSKIVCLALNNSANTDRIISGPKHPATFIKGANALTGHGQAIEIKPHYGRCHPEPELAVVIGRHAKNVSADEAYDYVFGYTIHNDITSPTMRREDTFHYRAIHPAKDDPTQVEYVETWVSYPGRYKGSDTFSPMGPWLVTRDDIADPHNLTISCHHQGELVTEDNTANLFYKVPQVLEFLSGYMTLLPGDIISMGTAIKRSGQGSRAVQNVELDKLGGPVSVTIEGIGTLSNEVEFLS